MPTGELDLATVSELDDALRRAEADSPLVVLDLRQLDFMDCSALGITVSASRRITRAGGRMLVVRGSEDMTRLLTLTGVDEALEIVDEPPVVARDVGDLV